MAKTKVSDIRKKKDKVKDLQKDIAQLEKERKKAFKQNKKEIISIVKTKKGLEKEIKKLKEELAELEKRKEKFDKNFGEYAKEEVQALTGATSDVIKDIKTVEGKQKIRAKRLKEMEESWGEVISYWSKLIDDVLELIGEDTFRVPKIRVKEGGIVEKIEE